MIWHSEQLENVVKTLKSDSQKGLSNGVAQQRLQSLGSNTLSYGKTNSYWSKLVTGLNNFPTIALLAVAAIS